MTEAPSMNALQKGSVLSLVSIIYSLGWPHHVINDHEYQSQRAHAEHDSFPEYHVVAHNLPPGSVRGHKMRDISIVALSIFSKASLMMDLLMFMVHRLKRRCSQVSSLMPVSDSIFGMPTPSGLKMRLCFETRTELTVGACHYPPQTPREPAVYLSGKSHSSCLRPRFAAAPCASSRRVFSSRCLSSFRKSRAVSPSRIPK